MAWFDYVKCQYKRYSIITVKNVDYHCIIHNIIKSEAINLLENSALEHGGYIYKKYCLNFFSDFFFLLFLFSIYKMVGIMDVYKFLNISIRIVMKNPEILKFLPKSS